MFDYFERIPAAALRRYFDGNTYAYVNHNVTLDGIKASPSPRFVKATDAKIKDGEAWVRIGSMGDKIAQVNNLPFAVSAVQRTT